MADSEKIFAYSYLDPLLDPVLDASDWGWEVDRVYQDLGERGQLQALLEACRQHPGAYLLIRHLAELGDSLAEVADRLTQLEACQTHLIAVQEAIGGDDQPLRRSDLLQLLSTIQSRQTESNPQRQGHARNRLNALPPPGKAPYGYRRSPDRYVVDRSTAPVVKAFFEHFLLYGSLRGAVRHLQQKYRKKISVSTGQRWLTSPVYRGDLQFHTGDVVTDTHAAILSRDEAAQIDRLLRRNSQLPARSASAPRSLSGLVVCGHCQSPMTVSRVARGKSRSKTTEYLYLRPTACSQAHPCRAIAYGQVLEQTIEQICRDLPSAIGSAPDLAGFKQGIMAEIAAKQAVLDQLPSLVSQGILDDETATLRSYRVRTEMATLQARAAQLPPPNLQAIAQLVSIPQFWLDLSEAERRFYFREFIREIQIVRTPGSETPTPSAPPTWNIRLRFIF